MMVPERTVSKFSERKRKFLCCVQEVSCSSRAMTAKKYTKRRDAPAKLLFC